MMGVLISIADYLSREVPSVKGAGMPRPPRPRFIPTLLGSGRIPTPLPAAIDDGDLAALHRHFACFYYDSCLSQIADKAWQSWTCCSCPSFPREQRALIPSSRPEVICAAISTSFAYADSDD